MTISLVTTNQFSYHSLVSYHLLTILHVLQNDHHSKLPLTSLVTTVYSITTHDYNFFLMMKTFKIYSQQLSGIQYTINYSHCTVHYIPRT